MKSIYLFWLGVILTLFCGILFIDSYGQEFIQDYWIERLWYGDLSTHYRTTLRIIVFITLFMIIMGVYNLGQNAKNEVDKEFESKNDK